MKKYVAEFIGTFTLAFVVLIAIANGGAVIAIPIVAGLTLALFVYTIGPISGSQINPAVTLGLLSIKKISSKDAVSIIVAQLLGAFFAIIIAKGFGLSSAMNVGVWSGKVFFAEMFGTLFFAFGIASVVYGKVKDEMSGLVIGGSLLLGIIISTLSGAAGILNPAVALSLNALTAVYLFAPIVGSVIGFQIYKHLARD